MAENLFTVKEAAVYLRLEKSVIYGMCTPFNSVLAHFRVGPRRGKILIAREECDRYLRASQVVRAGSQKSTQAAVGPAPKSGYQYRVCEPGSRRLIPSRSPGSNGRNGDR